MMRFAFRARLLAVVAAALLVQANGCGGDAVRADAPSATSDAVTADGGGAASGDAGPGRALFDTLVSELDGERTRVQAPAAQVAVILDGRLAFSAGLGTLRRDGHDPADDRALFQWGSVAKMFTAATVMSLVDDGTIALDAPVTRYVPYAHCAPPGRMDQVTVHDVLTHTSGYRDQLEFPTVPWPGNGTAPSALEDLFQAFDPTLRSAPGEVWSYSNLGYALAGLVAEQAAGKPFTELVKERVLTKSGMETATFDPAEAAQRTHAVGAGHMQQGGPVVDIDTDTLLGDVRRRPFTGLQASVVDVAHWVETVLAGGGTTLRKESVARMTSALVPTGSEGESYGYGFFVDMHNGRDIVQHSGGQSGFVSYVLMVPAARFGVVLVFSGAGAAPAPISYHAIDLFLGR